jgi:hypothetical protein
MLFFFPVGFEPDGLLYFYREGFDSLKVLSNGEKKTY